MLRSYVLAVLVHDHFVDQLVISLPSAVFYRYRNCNMFNVR
jgi:hypothetical protein